MTPGLETPKLTAAQLLAVAKDVVAVAVAFGAPLSQMQQVALLTLAGSSTLILLTADAAIRRARAKHVAAPLLDRAAADAIRAAATQANVPDPIRAATDRLASEAELEAEARAANEATPVVETLRIIADKLAPSTRDTSPAGPSDGIDPATL